MARKSDGSSVEGLVREILRLGGRRQGRGQSRLEIAERELESIGERDYSRQLEGHFSRRELSELFDALKTALPGLNRAVLRERELREFAKVASGLGAHFRATPFTGDAGRALRGFYARDGHALKRPLICINTAQHPIALASAFWHEIGHHLTVRMVGGEEANPSFGQDYREHLEDPVELLADMVVAVVAYPALAARRLFGRYLRMGCEPYAGEIASQARAYLRTTAGFEFDRGVTAVENLHYAAGMIHYAKLRWALLSAYEI